LDPSRTKAQIATIPCNVGHIYRLQMFWTFRKNTLTIFASRFCVHQSDMILCQSVAFWVPGSWLEVRGLGFGVFQSRPVVVSPFRILTQGLPLDRSPLPRSSTLARSTRHGSQRISRWVTGETMKKKIGNRGLDINWVPSSVGDVAVALVISAVRSTSQGALDEACCGGTASRRQRALSPHARSTGVTFEVLF